jgi:hypothetical protein
MLANPEILKGEAAIAWFSARRVGPSASPLIAIYDRWLEQHPSGLQRAGS